MFQTDLTHGASTYTVTAWLGKKSTGAVCALETTEQLKAYKTLEWPENLCLYRTTEGKPQDRTVLNLLLYHFILHNHISKIYYTATLQLPWKRVLCQSEPAWRHKGIRPVYTQSFRWSDVCADVLLPNEPSSGFKLRGFQRAPLQP